ncbi:hypothetical protein LCGC14_0526460 [marine sediment metagenome]|uniref:Uncharacterized protein n=1 Tax=marine sediment metagenome TaxID=412755 RepID=A0A0F9UIF4_9ZZZZ
MNKQIGYIIRLDDKPKVANQVLTYQTHQYLSPNDTTSNIRAGWPTYKEAKEAWEHHYNTGLELGVDHKEFSDVTIVKITIEEEKIEEL